MRRPSAALAPGSPAATAGAREVANGPKKTKLLLIALVKETKEEAVFGHFQHPKTIDAFRGNPAYGGDGTRIDLAYAVYALSHGVPDAVVRSALSSRDLSHKGNERRQQDGSARRIDDETA